MNDKQQLAAMGDELRLTEDQAKVLAERLPKTGVLQILDDEPLCMAKRTEELEAQVRVMASLLSETLNMVPAIGIQVADLPVVDNLLDRIDAAMSGRLPVPVVPDGWQLVPTSMDDNMLTAWRVAPTFHDAYRAMLSAAPKPEVK